MSARSRVNGPNTTTAVVPIRRSVRCLSRRRSPCRATAAPASLAPRRTRRCQANPRRLASRILAQSSRITRWYELAAQSAASARGVPLLPPKNQKPATRDLRGPRGTRSGRALIRETASPHRRAFRNCMNRSFCAPQVVLCGLRQSTCVSGKVIYFRNSPSQSERRGKLSPSPNRKVISLTARGKPALGVATCRAKCSKQLTAVNKSGRPCSSMR